MTGVFHMSNAAMLSRPQHAPQIPDITSTHSHERRLTQYIHMSVTHAPSYPSTAIRNAPFIVKLLARHASSVSGRRGRSRSGKGTTGGHRIGGFGFVEQLATTGCRDRAARSVEGGPRREASGGFRGIHRE